MDDDAFEDVLRAYAADTGETMDIPTEQEADELYHQLVEDGTLDPSKMDAAFDEVLRQVDDVLYTPAPGAVRLRLITDDEER